MDYNVNSGGLVLKTDGKLLLGDICSYSGTYMRDAASGETVLLDGIFWFMNQAEDGIYYSDQQRGHRLFRFDTALMTAEPLSDSPCYGLIRHGEWLYYINETDRKLYRCLMSGKNETRIADEPVESFIVEEEQVYYATGQGIRTCRITGGGREVVSDAVAAGLLLLGEKLVFADKKNRYLLSVLDLRTGSIDSYEDLVPGSMNSDGRFLYCTNRKHDGTIYRVDPESGSQIRICGERADHLHIVGDEMVFSSRYEWYGMSLSGGQAAKVIT
ncbi:DUF5050 domain-containing protein [Paenibacillus caui]|uniref:DUF5050 domain-containing protein n=1 Tax=Paenibacillus caui TaxID=2873927 RepID=UPI001CA9BD26